MIRDYKGVWPQIDVSCYVSESSIVIGKVKIGSKSNIWDYAVIRGDVDEIIIGENSNIQDLSILHVNESIPIIIGDRVTIGHGVKLHGCQIDNNTLIGIGAIVLNGAKIGKNCIIGAGTLITPNTFIPDNMLVLGAPGKVMRELKSDEIEQNKLNAMSYVKLAEDYKT